MANDAHALSFPPQGALSTQLPTIAFTGLMLLVFVGLDAFSPPPLVAAYGGASSGDALRQVSYLAVFALVAILTAQRLGLAVVRVVPVSILLLLSWCLLSALWALAPDVVIRRAGLGVVIVLSVFLSMSLVGPQRAFHILKWLLAIVLAVNLLSIPLMPIAVHPPGEIDPALVGNWRGLYGHKNIAGTASAITAILFLFTRNGKGNRIGFAIAAAATFFLVMSHSKSSLGFLPMAVLAGWAYRLGWREGLGRAIMSVIALMALLGIAVTAALYSDQIMHILTNPAELTGRSAIWAAELAYIADHPLLGHGFGTFADAGGLSPLAPYVDSQWVATVSHGHNGYLQVLVTIGGIGFLLTMLATVILPAIRFWRLDDTPDGRQAMYFALFVFLVLHNLMESDFLEGDGVAWVTMLMVVAAQRLDMLSVNRSLTARA